MLIGNVTSGDANWYIPTNAVIFGQVHVNFPSLDKKITESAAAQASKSGKPGRNDDWLECRSDESDKSDHDYKYEEDPDNMVVKKYKK